MNEQEILDRAKRAAMSVDEWYLLQARPITTGGTVPT
jgi:hypothetical protein